MTAAAIIEAVRARFVAQVETPQAATLKVVHDNGPDPAPSTPLWCRFAVELDPPQQVSTVPARYRTRGRAFALLHSAVQKGDAELLALFAVIETAFTGVILATPMLRFHRPGLVGVASIYGGWFRRTARIEFYADEVGIGS